MKILTRSFAGVVLVMGALVLTFACSSTPKNPNSNLEKDRGFKTVEATVVARDREAPATMSGNPVYYLEFEAREGEANTHYRFEVNQTQYNRYQEGTHVQLIIGDNRLRDIRLVQ